MIRSRARRCAYVVGTAVVGTACTLVAPVTVAIQGDGEPRARTVVTSTCQGGGKVTFKVVPRGDHVFDLTARAHGLPERSRWDVALESVVGVGGDVADFRRRAHEGGWQVRTRFESRRTPEIFQVMAFGPGRRGAGGFGDGRVCSASVSASGRHVYFGGGCRSFFLGLGLGVFDRERRTLVAASSAPGVRPGSPWTFRYRIVTDRGIKLRRDVRRSTEDGFLNSRVRLAPNLEVTGVHVTRISEDGRRCAIRGQDSTRSHLR